MQVDRGGATASAIFRSANAGWFEWGGNRLNIAEWEGNFDAILTPVGTSANAASKFAKVIDAAEWSLEMPWDEANMPDTTLGLKGGVSGNAKFQIGGQSAKYYTLTGTTVEGVKMRNKNSEGVVRATVRGKGGVIGWPA